MCHKLMRNILGFSQSAWIWKLMRFQAYLSKNWKFYVAFDIPVHGEGFAILRLIGHQLEEALSYLRHTDRKDTAL